MNANDRTREILDLKGALTITKAPEPHAIYRAKPLASIISRLTLPKLYYYISIMCGYQCDKAVTKNDTREVI